MSADIEQKIKEFNDADDDAVFTFSLTKYDIQKLRHCIDSGIEDQEKHPGRSWINRKTGKLSGCNLKDVFERFLKALGVFHDDSFVVGSSRHYEKHKECVEKNIWCGDVCYLDKPVKRGRPKKAVKQ